MRLSRYCICVFALVWITHFLSKTITVSDSKLVLPLAMSMIKEHNTDLDEYQSLFSPLRYPGVDVIDGHYYYYASIGTPILAAPVLEAINLVGKRVYYIKVFDIVKNGWSAGIELFIASLFVAITSVFVFLMAFELTFSARIAFLVTFVFAFCTPAWSTASRALWSHTGSILMLSISLYALLRAKRNTNWLFLAGLALAYSYVSRPTNSLPIIFFTLYVLIAHRKQILIYGAGMVLIFIPFLAYNYHIYHHLLSPYYQPSTLHVGATTTLWEGFTGTLFSPSRGLLIFTPVVLFSLAGVIMLVKTKKFTWLDAAVVMIIISHTYVISSITTPFAGWSFGPRYFTDMTPFFAYFLVFFIRELPEIKTVALKYTLIFFFVLTTGFSFFVHYKGATHPDTFFKWNGEPDIQDHPERYWDWNDLQFMR